MLVHYFENLMNIITFLMEIRLLMKMLMFLLDRNEEIFFKIVPNDKILSISGL